MSEALEVVIRYFVAAGCGWLSVHGLKGFDDANIVSSVVTVAVGVLPFIAVVARALYKSTIPSVIARLQARHKAALLDGAAAVPGVSKIVATPQLAADTDSHKVVAGATS